MFDSIGGTLIGIFVFGFVITLIVLNGIARANEYYKQTEYAKEQKKIANKKTAVSTKPKVEPSVPQRVLSGTNQ